MGRCQLPPDNGATKTAGHDSIPTLILRGSRERWDEWNRVCSELDASCPNLPDMPTLFKWIVFAWQAVSEIGCQRNPSVPNDGKWAELEFGEFDFGTATAKVLAIAARWQPIPEVSCLADMCHVVEVWTRTGSDADLPSQTELRGLMRRCELAIETLWQTGTIKVREERERTVRRLDAFQDQPRFLSAVDGILAKLRDVMAGASCPERVAGPAVEPEDLAAGGDDDDQDAAHGDELPECLVTMQQAAAMVSRDKRTIERWVSMKSCPRPRVLGGGGKPHEYAWSELRPFLEKQSGRKLPEQFPFQRFRPV